MKKSAQEREWLFYQRLARRAKKGLKVPQEFLDCTSSMVLFLVKTDKANKDAAQLNDMRRSGEHGLSSIQEYLNKHPVDAMTYMRLLTTERSSQQSDAAKKTRPKDYPTNISLTVESMRLWRNNDHTLEEFISAAKNGSVEGLELEEFEKANKRRFTLNWESLETTEKKDSSSSLRTLEDWWTEAGREKK